MYQVIIVIHVLLGLGVIGLVLLQQGKGADAGAAFGSASSGSVFGAQGAASFLSRTTAILASLFFVTSLGLAVLSGYQSGDSQDLMDEIETPLSEVPLVGDSNGSKATDDTPSIIEGVSDTSLPEKAIEATDNVTEAVQDSAQKVVEAADQVKDKSIETLKETKDITVEKLEEINPE